MSMDQWIDAIFRQNTRVFLVLVSNWYSLQSITVRLRLLLGVA